MNNRLFGSLLSCALIALFACSPAKQSTRMGKTDATRPVHKTLPPLKESVISIPVKVVVRPFLQNAEKLAPKEIKSAGWPNYINSSCDFRYKYRFVRSAFQFSCINNRISVAMNGNYQIAGSKTICVMNQAVYPWVNGSCGFGSEPMRRVNINLVSAILFTPDYRIQTFTRVDKVQAIDKCLVTVFKTDVTQEILDSIAASVNAFGKEIDAQVRNLNFDSTLLPLAEKSGKKIPLGSYGFLSLNASGVNLGAINYHADTLSFKAGITCFPEISSDSANYHITRHLPPLKGNQTGNGFSLSANAIYDYRSIDTLLTRLLSNRVFDIKGERIRVSEVKLRGLDNYKVEFKLSFTGTKKGTLFLTGSPELDTIGQVISVPDLEYDLNASSLVLQLGKTFFNRKILESLRKQATLPITELYQKNKTLIDSQFNRVVTDGVFLQGVTNSLQLNGLVVNKDNLQVQVSVLGEIGLVIAKFPGN